MVLKPQLLLQPVAYLQCFFQLVGLAEYSEQQYISFFHEKRSHHHREKEETGPQISNKHNIYMK